MSNDTGLARRLGWVSLGLGVPLIVATRQIAQLIGVKDDSETQNWMRVVGMREITAGLGLLSGRRPAGWLWSRVAGDAMDLTLLSIAMSGKNVQPGRLMAATASIVGITLVDLLSSLRYTSDATSGRNAKEKAMHVQKSITVNRAPEEVYRFWRDFGNLPRFMRHLESVQTTGNGRSHWKAKAPAGQTVEWDAEITDDQPNQRIAWHSLAGADVDNSGTVRFAPGPHGAGTIVQVQMDYDAPGGAIGKAIATLFGEEPEHQVDEDLRIFKQVMETGEVAKSDASVRQHPGPAQPPDFAAGP